jgi:hypothetical protein
MEIPSSAPSKINTPLTHWTAYGEHFVRDKHIRSNSEGVGQHPSYGECDFADEPNGAHLVAIKHEQTN